MRKITTTDTPIPEKYARVVVSNFMKRSPSTKQVGEFLASIANNHNIDINKTVFWKIINEYYDFNLSDFQCEIVPVLTTSERGKPLYNRAKVWRFKPVKVITKEKLALMFD